MEAINTIQELRETLNKLEIAMYERETILEDNGGEVTEEVEDYDFYISLLQGLINKDGLDLLGGWLKSIEDKKNALKAEKDYISRQIAHKDETMDFVKKMIIRAMDLAGVQKTEKSVRGYQFTRMESNTTSVDKDLLNIFYKDKINRILAENHIPSYVTVTLSGSSKAYELFKENGAVPDGDEDIFKSVTEPSLRFTKPRANKE